MKLINLLNQDRPVLLEGSVLERIRRRPDLQLDEELLNGPLIYSAAGRKALARIWTGYLSVALRFERAMLLAAPTWRLSRDRVAASAWSGRNINAEAVAFGQAFRLGYEAGRPEHGQPILIGALMACRGDAYNPAEALSTTEAEVYHAWQAEKLIKAGPDYILATTLPQAGEALGLAKALARAPAGDKPRPPYLLSFVIRPDGCILDGTPLDRALTAIDAALAVDGLQLPLGYLVSCVYPATLKAALDRLGRVPRLIGLQANGSALSPAELDGAAELKSERPSRWAGDFQKLLADRPLKLLGGCCGTTERHLAALAEVLETSGGKKRPG